MPLLSLWAFMACSGVKLTIIIIVTVIVIIITIQSSDKATVWTTRFRIPERARDFSLLQNVQADSESHPSPPLRFNGTGASSRW
jgi:hypothetical protein